MQTLTFRQRVWRLLPAIALTLILALLWKSLIFKDQPMAREKVNHSFPAFELYDEKSKKYVTQKTLQGKPHIVHIWATWCGICVKEHPIMNELKNKVSIPMVSVIYRDDPKKAMNFLNSKGNPYQYVLVDRAGKLGQSLGLVGVPETYVVDANGRVRFHVSGDLNRQVINNKIVPLVEKLGKERAQ